MDEFDQLPILMRQSSDEIRPEDLGLLHRAWTQLLTRPIAINDITRENAGVVATELFERLRAGSRLLGEVIIISGEAADRKDYEAAKFEIREFLRFCDMPFYRKIAEERLRMYEQFDP
jgi:hypothetical protein